MTGRQYVRVSTREQAKGHSPAAQRQDLDEWCMEEKWEPTVLYDDSAFTGADEMRPALKRLQKDAKDGDVIVAAHPDRLHRNTEDQLRFLRVMGERGVRVRFLVIRNIDPATPEGQLVVTNLAMIAEYFLKDLKRKTRRGVKKASDEGFWSGTIPDLFDTEDGEVVQTKHGPRRIRYIRPSTRARELLAEAKAEGVYRTAERRGLNPTKLYRLRRVVARWDDGVTRGIRWRQLVFDDG